MNTLTGLRTLLLDSSFTPILTLSWQRAVVLDFQDRVAVLEYYDAVARTTRDEFPVPAVMRLRQYLRYSRARIHFSRRNVLYRDGMSCQYCGVRGTAQDLTIDHVLPRSRGGTNAWTNVVAACARCNHSKGDRTPEEAAMTLRSRPEMPDLYTWSRLGLGQDVPEQWRDYLRAVS